MHLDRLLHTLKIRNHALGSEQGGGKMNGAATKSWNAILRWYKAFAILLLNLLVFLLVTNKSFLRKIPQHFSHANLP